MNINKKEKVLSTLAILLTVFFWGISTSSSKIAIAEVPPSTLALLRFTIASIILFTIKKAKYKKEKLKRGDILPAMLCGLVGVTIYFNFENYGVSLISAANATILLAAVPLFTIILERIVFKTPIGLQKGLGICLSILGVSFVIRNSLSINTNMQEIIGSLLLIGAALSWASYSILSKKLDGKYPTVFLTFYQNLFGAIFLIPFSLVEHSRWQPISPSTWIHILYLGAICSALCYFLYLFALKNLGASSTNVYINLMPFVGVFAANIMLGEQLYPLQLLGGITIVIGVYIVNAEKSILVNKVAKPRES
ncbi:DMT family transporter [Serpentinicella sp. ANB-PHB4]|uniref:DMT family transporter n=1 Tax=Serpentinicella sp. ANB-PHB4 TaxID=3074076 RepID=UPI00285874EC|nr:DMT family transporter [Serpentinicella sp. ANB-PHB4]MDR5659465.1 DMT family transporter [Serpentinicella sp. ANB-PHB4]